jgi:hypothetical protein
MVSKTPIGREIKIYEELTLQISDAGVTITDYTNNDDYKSLLPFMEIFGIKQRIRTESWCG